MPYKAPGLDDPRQSWILTEINKSQTTLDRLVAEAQSLPSSDLSRSSRISRYNAVKRELGGSFNDLDKNIRLWSERDVPSLYKSGWFVGAGQTGANFDFTLPHREALDVISFDAYDDIATRLQLVSQGFNDTVDLQKLYEGLSLEDQVAIQARTRSAVAQALLTGEADPKKVARGLAQDLWRDNPKLKIIDSAGREWKMETYTRMLVRTKSGNAYNSGSLNKYAEEGVKRVKVFDGLEDDPECAAANGQTWSLRYAMSNVLQHPNCRRAFAPVSGEGEVDKETDQPVTVVFDRVELGITALAALRYFGRTGDTNLSSTLARFVFEVIESQTFPMPVIDGFVMGLASQGLRSADAWIQSYIDPILFYSGVVRNIPPKAQFAKASRPEVFLDHVADTVRKANLEAFGTEFNPQVRAVVGRLTALSLKVDSGVLAAKAVVSGRTDGWKFLDFIIEDALDTNRLGQIVAETLIRVRDGDTALRDAYEASVTSLDQFRKVKALHLRTLSASLDEVGKIYEELTEISEVLARVIADDLSIGDAPDAVVDAIQRFSLLTAGFEDITDFRQERLLELLDLVREGRRDALERINELSTLRRTGTGRTLSFPSPTDIVYPSETSYLWDIDQFEGAVSDLSAAIGPGTFENRVARFRIDPFYDMNRVMGDMVARMSDDAKAIEFDFIRPIDPFEFVESPELLQLIESYYSKVDWSDPFESFQAYVSIVNRVARRSDGEIYIRGGPRNLDGVFARGLSDLGEILNPEVFVRHPEIWRQTKALGASASTPPTMDKWIVPIVGLDSRSQAKTMRNLWVSIYKDDLQFFDDLVTGVNISNIEEQLESLFPDLVNLGYGGVNGDTYAVRVGGMDLFVKPLRASSHQGGRHNGVMSEILTGWVSDSLEDTFNSVPFRVISINETGDAIGVMPFLDDVELLRDTYLDIEQSQLRRMTLLDFLTKERDSHYGNFGITSYDEIGVSFDNETGFRLASGLIDPDNNVFENEEIYRGYADTFVERWSRGETAEFLDLDGPPAVLVQLSRAELEMTDGLTPDEYVQHANNFYRSREELFAKSPMPLVFDNDQEVWYLPAGRVAQNITKDGSEWRVPHFLNKVELEFVDKVLNDTEVARDEIVAALKSGLDQVDDSFTNAIRTEWVSTGGSLDDSLEVVAEQVLIVLDYHYSRAIDQGVINILGGKTSVVNSNGSVFTIGEVVDVLNEVTGQSAAGTVIGLFERRDGTVVADLATNVGLKLSSSQIESKGGIDLLRLPVEQWVAQTDTVANAQFAARVRRSLDSVAESVEPWDLTPVDDFIVTRPVLDEFGLQVGRDKSELTIGFANNRRDVLRVVDGDDEVGSHTISALWSQNEDLQKALRVELSKVPEEYRPRTVIIHLNPMETLDRKLGHGFYDEIEDELHVSIFSAIRFDEQVALGTEEILYNVLPSGVRAVDSKGVTGLLDADAVQEVIRHELSHSVELGKERSVRQRVVGEIWDQINTEFPDARTRRDLNEVAIDLLPVDTDLSQYDDATDALISIRAALVEDIINTNLIEDAKVLFDSDGIPAWAKRAYNGVLTGDPEAHHEFFAEIWSSVARNGGDIAAVRKTARELGVSEATLRSYLRRDVPSMPPSWDVSTIDFQIWLSEVLNPNAKRIIPRVRSDARQLWKKSGLDVSALSREVREAGPGKGGFTVNLAGDSPDSGFSVALSKFEKIVKNPSGDDIDSSTVEFVAKHRKLIEENPELQLGSWYDSDGNYYLDVVRVFDDEVDAANFGYVENQRSMFSFNTFDTIDLLDDQPDFISWMAKAYPGVSQEKYLAKNRRIGAVKTKTKKSVVIRTDDGEFAPLGMEVFGVKDQKKILDSLDLYHYLATEEAVEALEALSKADLQDIAKEIKLAGRSGMTKAQLVTEISIKQANPGGPIVSVAKGKQRLIEVLEKFIQENHNEKFLTGKDGKIYGSLRDKYRFYEVWRDELIEVSKRTGVPAPNIIAGAARMSPGLDADKNLFIAKLMGELVGENSGLGHRLSRKEAESIRHFLGESLDEGEAYRYLHAFDKPKPERAAEFVRMSKTIKSGTYLNSYDPVVGAYIVHMLTRRASKNTVSLSTRYGFPHFQMALAVMQQRIPIDEALGDTKVRSFFNNILDPNDLAKIGDVTSDFHMTDMFLGGITRPKLTYKGDEPKVLGMGAGLRPIIGDTVRELMAEGWGERVGADVPSDLQEILWGTWRTGKENGWWGDLRHIGKRKTPKKKKK